MVRGCCASFVDSGKHALFRSWQSERVRLDEAWALGFTTSVSGWSHNPSQRSRCVKLCWANLRLVRPTDWESVRLALEGFADEVGAILKTPNLDLGRLCFHLWLPVVPCGSL